MIAVQLFSYLSIAVLIIGILYKVIKISNLPTHLRWDLYPIPHEKEKAHYGGSYYEDPDWWKKPRDSSFLCELKEMAREIFAIQTLYRNNRTLWYFSFPFHLGLYFLTGFIGLLFLGAILQIGGIAISFDSLNLISKSIYYLTIAFGAVGLILGAIGSTGLFLSRIFKPELRRYSTITDYLNLLLLLSIFITGIIAWLNADKAFAIWRYFTMCLISFRPIAPIPTIFLIESVLIGIFFLYMPFTHMTHFAGKYFAFHKVRWQDEPSKRGGDLEQDIIEALCSKLSWSASHIKAGKTWVEAATDLDEDSQEEGHQDAKT